MVVENKGYLKKADVINMIGNSYFAIYETYKNTNILIMCSYLLGDNVHLYYPKKDKLPYKTVDGRKITSGKKVFDSKKDDVSLLENIKWNNGNQILSYKEFSN